MRKNRLLCLLFSVMLLFESVPAFAAGGLESWGRVDYLNEEGQHICVDSSDFYKLSGLYATVRNNRNAEYSEGYNTGLGDTHGSVGVHDLVCVHHVHETDNGRCNADVLYQLGCPGRCYTSGYHTHNAPGLPGCPGHNYEARCPGSYRRRKVYKTDENGNTTWSWRFDCYICGKRGSEGSRCTRRYTSWAWDCGSPANTWPRNCGKSLATIEYREFKFLTPIEAYDMQVNSRGILSVGDSSSDSDVLLNMSELSRMCVDLTDTACLFRKEATNRFLQGCKARGNSHGISKTEFITHTHDSDCYDADGNLICGETLGVSVDGMKVWYAGSYLYHVHEGTASDGSILFADDTVLHQAEDPGGCFVGIEHEHTEDCAKHYHDEDCYEECDCNITYEPYGSTFYGECPLPDCYVSGHQGIYQRYKEVHSGDCGAVPKYYVKQIGCRACNRVGIVRLLTDENGTWGDYAFSDFSDTSHMYAVLTCLLIEGEDYDCEGEFNVWGIGCGKSTADRE